MSGRPQSTAITISSAFLIALSGCGSSAHQGTATIPGQSGLGAIAVVIHVVDGDTVDLRFAAGSSERARLLGIDTPETVKPNTPIQCFGPEASAHTKKLLAPGTKVIVQRDGEARDRYGRLLVYLWRASDGRFVNGDLVTAGFARTLSIAPNTAHRADLAAAAAAAAAADVGLWGTCPPEPAP